MLLPGFGEQVRVVLLPGFGEQVKGGLLLGFGEQARVVVCESQGRQHSYQVLVEAALLPGFGEQVRGITFLSRCVGAQEERFFQEALVRRKGTCELKVLRTENVLVE
ncbi:hypothetical protein DEO72_LG2g3834 [Vigna unguiculata]|uniref:Uncharacterized protein n=1 Tax=Vigna unguiculata TaxID=3917 RepID=A0A4D6L4T3_VIGUN|nr:hypothetical protein DEO72_LG2g3834 [Vigna unguiculata]